VPEELAPGLKIKEVELGKAQQVNWNFNIERGV
jgi:hypothetical protein